MSEGGFLFRKHTHTHLSADKSTVIPPTGDRDLEFPGAAAVPPRSLSPSGDLTPALTALIDYLQARHGGARRLPSFLFSSLLATLHPFIINKSFFSLLGGAGRPPDSQATLPCFAGEGKDRGERSESLFDTN